jgi:hypothetical protein
MIFAKSECFRSSENSLLGNHTNWSAKCHSQWHFQGSLDYTKWLLQHVPTHHFWSCAQFVWIACLSWQRTNTASVVSPVNWNTPSFDAVRANRKSAKFETFLITWGTWKLYGGILSDGKLGSSMRKEFLTRERFDAFLYVEVVAMQGNNFFSKSLYSLTKHLIVTKIANGSSFSCNHCGKPNWRVGSCFKFHKLSLEEMKDVIDWK